MSEYVVTHTFVVRGRPVGFAPGRFGGALVAVERGCFPISSTGYRSLAGHAGGAEPLAPEAVSADFLETLAVTQDRARLEVLNRLHRPPTPSADRLGNFIAVHSAAVTALENGFFAPDPDRVALWTAAYRALRLIAADPSYQPVPSGPAWTPGVCAEALAQSEGLLVYLRQLAAGVFAEPAEGSHFPVRAYFRLPPRPGGEPPFALPAETVEFALGLPQAAHVEKIEPSVEDATGADVCEARPAEQLSLF